MATGHWDVVWSGRDPDEVTWFQAEPTISLRLIESIAEPADAVIDIGGGASRLVDGLLAAGYCDVTVLDVAAASIGASQHRLGAVAARAEWVVADANHVTFDRTFDVWHDRAVFHFLVDADDRRRYLATLAAALALGGHIVLSTFGPDGPEMCSGLPVRRYSIESMCETLGDGYVLIDQQVEQHVAPNGLTQQFVYGLFRRAESDR